MNERECIERMVAPGTPRQGKYRGGVIQVHVTRACDKSCFACTQGSNLAGKQGFITPEQFETAILSLKGYWGVVGMFGGNPAVHSAFPELCAILRQHVPFEQRGLWCNNPMNEVNGKAMRATFDPAVSNLNVHLDSRAYHNFRRWWPESRPFGLDKDSRHSPPYVAMMDVEPDEEKRWELISGCDINKHWSAMVGVFRGQVRAWFCEVAGAQAMLHQDDPSWPDTGIDLTHPCYVAGQKAGEQPWWNWHMTAFAHQVRHHCHRCGVPLRGYGELAQTESLMAREQVSAVHQAIYKPKRAGRAVELVTLPEQLGKRLERTTHYLQNAER